MIFISLLGAFSLYGMPIPKMGMRQIKSSRLSMKKKASTGDFLGVLFLPCSPQVLPHLARSLPLQGQPLGDESVWQDDAGYIIFPCRSAKDGTLGYASGF